jgi:hypothetical protein
MEVYMGADAGLNTANSEEEGMLEFDLDEEKSTLVSEVMAIAVYYSHESYNPQFLLADMVKAWNVNQLSSIEKIGDYIFKLEFTTPEKTRVLEGVPGAIRET